MATRDDHVRRDLCVVLGRIEDHHAIAAFGRDPRGSTAVEFALLATPLFMLLLGISELGFDLYCSSVIGVAAHKAARQIQVGTVQQNNLDSNGFASLTCGYLPSFMSCANLIYDVRTVSGSFYDLTTASQNSSGITQYAIRRPSLNRGQNMFCPGPSNSFVVVQFLYVVPVISGIWLTSSVTYNGSSVRVVAATEVFRNESFTASNTGAGC